MKSKEMTRGAKRSTKNSRNIYIYIGVKEIKKT